MKKAILSGLFLLFAVNALAQQSIDPATLNKKIICGYQGWFTCPNDNGHPDVKWFHWFRNNQPGYDNFRVEMWPDLSECDPDELYPVPGIVLTDGKPGYLFSSVNRKTVVRHFKWMKEYGIDGVFLQRFITDTYKKGPRFIVRNKVLANVRAGANKYGRVFALEYDTIGAPKDTLYHDITSDWKYLVDKFQIRKDPRYLHHNGKPVIVIWGLGFRSKNRPFSPELANKIIDFFKNDPKYGGNYCIGGVPTGWRQLKRDSKTDPKWAKVFRRWDAVTPWTVARYKTPAGVRVHGKKYWAPDVRETKKCGMDYIPVVWPGFSWDNHKELPHGKSIKPRLNGKFFWSQIHAAQKAGAQTIFVAMFDEVDEATAIFKISDVHPIKGHWITYKGLPNDWYLRLTGAAGKMLRGEIKLSEKIPIDP